MTTNMHELLFKRALEEDLDRYREKVGFVPPPSKTGQQAAGPGGAPVDPMAAGGAPPAGDPMAAMGGAPPPPGGAPMDPMADPMAAMGGGAPPPPGGAPPPPGGDPLAGLEDLMGGGGGGEPAPEDEPPPDTGGGDGISTTDSETLQTIQQNTMDIVRQALEMVGKAKPQEEQKAETEANVAKLESDAQAAAPEAASTPGPVTGQPVDAEAASQIPGPLKLGQVLARARGRGQRPAQPAITSRVLGGAAARAARAVKKEGSALAWLQKVAKRDAPGFLEQDRPKKEKEVYSAVKREHPEYPAAKKARIAASAANKAGKGQNKEGSAVDWLQKLARGSSCGSKPRSQRSEAEERLLPGKGKGAKKTASEWFANLTSGR